MSGRKIRIQFDLTPEALQRLDLLKDRAGVMTRAELIRRALAVFADQLEKEN